MTSMANQIVNSEIITLEQPEKSNISELFENIPGAINRKRQIISTIQLYKIVYPKEAYHLMRNLCFNIDHKKKYEGRYINARLTIIPV